MPMLDFEQVFARLPSPYMVLDENLRFVAANSAYERATMRSASEFIGNYVFDEFPNEGESGRLLLESFRRVLKTGRNDTIANLAYDIPRPKSAGGGFEKRFWTAHHAPLPDETGTVRFIVQNTVDVTEAVRTQRRQRLLLDELDHRVKNTLATVQSLAGHTFRYVDDQKAAARVFEGRLLALSHVHNLLSANEWASARFHDILEIEVGGAGRSRVSMTGPDVLLGSEAAVALAMVVHELAANAVTHGALSGGHGRIAIDWRHDGADADLTIDWTETDGPKVDPDAHGGFGTRMIERLVSGDLSGRYSAEFTLGGFRCRIDIPASAIGTRMDDAYNA